MLRKHLFFWSTLLCVLLTVQCTVDDDKIVGPIDSLDKYIIFKSFTSSKYQLFTQGDEATITLEVINAEEEPSGEGIVVDFTSELGTITARDTVDSDGTASAIYISGETAGVDKIMVNSETKADSLFLYLVNQAADVALSTDSTDILADGEMSVGITALVTDEDDLPMSGITVYFDTDYGTITENGDTDEEGKFTARLTSTVDSLDVTTMVRVGFNPFTSAKTVTPTVTVQTENSYKIEARKELLKSRSSFGEERPEISPLDENSNKSEAPEILVRETAGTDLGDSLQITFRGVSIQIQSNKTELLANGEDLADIYISIYETTTGNPVTEYDFTATTNRGTILGTTTTDENGQSSLELRSGSVPGEATIRVSAGGISGQMTVSFISTYPTAFEITQTENIILADGVSSTTITASVFDTLGNPVQGANLNISATNGVLDYSTIVTDDQGEVEANLISVASQTNLTALVKMSVIGYPDLSDSTTIEFKGVTLSSYADEIQLVANGNASTTITAVVYQTASNSAIADREVNFSTSLGTINSPVTTSGSGVAEATLTAGIFEGIATVVVRFGDLITDTVSVEMLSSGASSLDVNSEDTNIRADGLTAAAIVATVADTLGNPVTGTLVNFSTDTGELSNNYATSNSQGIAEVELIAPASKTDLSTWVTASISSGAAQSYQVNYASGFNLRTSPARIYENTPAVAVTTPELIDSIQINMKGITVNSYPQEEAIIADGNSTTNIIATIRETSTNAPVQNETVTFSTDLGSITGETTTSGSGVATATLTSGLIDGEATIVVFYGATLTDTTTVNIFGSEPDQLSFTQNQDYILANGIATNTYTAQILDTLGNAIIGESISFNTTLGTLSESIVYTDDEGFAVVELTSTARTIDTSATVTATVTAYPELTRSLNVDFRGITINSQSEDLSITADGISSTEIIVTLFETTNHGAIPSQVVNFATSLGTITNSIETDINGIASATLSSGIIAGTAKIYITTGSALHDTIEVSFLNHNPHSVNISTDETSILADGEASTGIIVQVVDTLDNPVAGTAISLSADFGQLNSNSETTDSDGNVYFTFTSDANTADQDAKLIATVTYYPTVMDSTIITMRGMTLDITADPTEISADGVSVSELTINLRETGNGNPVVDKQIMLGTTRGTIPSSVLTDDSGIATASLISNTLPGTAVVTADAGISESVSVDFLSTLPTAMTIGRSETSILANGSSTAYITASVTDTLGNPVIGTEIEFSTDAGTLSESTVNTDTEGLASVTLTSAASSNDQTAKIVCTAAERTTVKDSLTVKFRGITMNIESEHDEIPADGNSTSSVTVGLKETANGNPITATTVSWSTTLGVIPSTSTTNDLGFASTTLTAGMDSGTATVTANAGVTASTDIELLPITPDEVTVNADAGSLIADNHATTIVSATVIDALDNPLAGITVNFTASEGTLSAATVITNQDGYAATTYTGTARTDDSSAEIKAVLDGYNIVRDSLAINLRGLNLQVSADPGQLPADGSSTSDITIILTETTNGNPVSNKAIAFSTDLGTIISEGLTGETGRASVSLIAGTTPGTATVNVDAGVTASTTVEFISAAPTTLAISSTSNSIMADSDATATITANLTDALGNGVSDASVNFTTNGGTLSSSSALTDADGYATVILTSEALSFDYTAEILAVTDGYTAVRDSLEVTFRGLYLDVSFSPDQIPADGESTITIDILHRETTNGNPVAGKSVSLSTDKGYIPASVTTDVNGAASAELTSNTSPGTATVTVSVPSMTYSFGVDFLSVIPTAVSFSASNTSILSDQSSTSDLTATVTDVLGNPLSDITVGFTANAGTVSSTTGTTDASGQTTITFTSPASTSDGAAEVKAILSDYTTVRDSLDIDLRGVTMLLTADPESIPADGSSSSAITVDLHETTSGNPVVNKSLAISTDLGTIPSEGLTGTNGQATISLTAGMTPGTATVTVDAGIIATTAVDFLSTAPTTIAVSTGSASLLADADATTTISASLTDILGNAVSGATVNFTAASGTLSSSNGVTDSDGIATVELTSSASTANVSTNILVVAADNATIRDSIDVTYRGLTLEVSASPDEIPADGSSTASITAILTETTNGNPVINKVLAVSTDRGIIASEGITGTNGRATIILTAGTSAGTATITVDAGITATTTVDFISAAPAALAISTSSTSIIADGEATATITANLTDALGNTVSDARVNFTTSGGSLGSSSALTDTDGNATMVLTSAALSGDIDAEILAVADGYAAVRDSLDVTFRGLFLDVSRSADQIPADGASTITIDMLYRETTSGNPVATKTISLATSRGYIPASVETDENGAASAELTSSTSPGTATVTITIPSQITTFDVDFLSVAPTAVSLAASSTSILSNQSSTSDLTATVTDVLGNPLSDITVGFTTDAGTVSSATGTTNANGQVIVTLTSPASTSDSAAEVKAILSDYASVRDSLDIDLRGVTMAVTASPERIPADGISTSAITIDLHETTNGNPVTGEWVTLNTNRGSITATDITDPSGLLTVDLTSSTASGTATVTATAGVSATAEVEFSALSFDVTAIDNNLKADGASSVDITATLKDAVTGNPLSDRTVYWSTDLGTIPASSTTDASGEALAALTAGTQAGTAKVYGRYGDSLIDSVSITISAVTDSSIILSWYNSSGNPGDGTEELTIAAILSDENGNPVEANTISFTLNPSYLGSITASDATAADGTADATLTYSTQHSGEIIRVIATSESGNIENYIDITLPELN